MSFIWENFNIKTFPAETLVFRDGEFCSELSDYENCDFNQNNNLININRKSHLPFHIIYVGEISGDINLNISVFPENTEIFLTMKILNKKPTNLNINIKNMGEHSVFKGEIIEQNYDVLKMNVTGEHLCGNTSISVKTRVLCHKNSKSELNGFAIIKENTEKCDSDISFSAMSDDTAQIIMKPTQFIKSVPENASHSASIYHPNDNQILYLRESGLSGDEVKKALEEAFLTQI